MDNETEKLYDITEVCRLLGTTSRTLRFYEEKGMIESTVVFPSARRKYTEKQLEVIRDVLVLRALGIPIKTILAYRRAEKRGDADLQQLIVSRRAELCASIDSGLRQINLLTGALSAIDTGKPISAVFSPSPEENRAELALAQSCADAVLNGDTESLYAHMSERMKQYLPPEAYNKVRSDTFLPLGDFVSAEKITADPALPGRYCMTARFTALGLKISLVIIERRIEGLWFGYCDNSDKVKSK